VPSHVWSRPSVPPPTSGRHGVPITGEGWRLSGRIFSLVAVPRWIKSTTLAQSFPRPNPATPPINDPLDIHFFLIPLRPAQKILLVFRRSRAGLNLSSPAGVARPVTIVFAIEPTDHQDIGPGLEGRVFPREPYRSRGAPSVPHQTQSPRRAHGQRA